MVGPIEDWIELKDRVKALSKFDLEFWISKLLPVLDKFIEAASGNVDKDFWDCCYKTHYRGGSGAVTTVKGWVTLFYPYNSNIVKIIIHLFKKHLN
jgi:hypothetical protein